MSGYAFDKSQLREMLHRDVELMLGFYIGEELDLEVPDMHCELWEELIHLLEKINHPEFLVGILQKLMAIPRDHAKTTIVKLAVILFLRYSRLSFCAYASNTFPGALNALRDVMKWFESQQDQNLFGPCKRIKSNESDGLYILTISTPMSDKPKRIILKAFGYKTQIRGTLIDDKRPDLLVFDDIESTETASSEAQQNNLDQWCLGTARPAMARRGVCLFIGNMVGDKCLLARLAQNPLWNPTILGSIVRNHLGELQPLWPGRWTLAALFEEYAEYRRLGKGHIWEAERMNLTTEDIFGASLAGCYRPTRPVPDMLEAGFICLDPAFGKNSWNDDSAITVHARVMGDPVPSVIDSRKGRMSEEEIFDEMLSLSMHWGIRTWVIETQAAQKLLIPLFKSLMTIRRLSETTILMLPILAGRESKASRILAFRDAVVKGSYWIAETEEELKESLEIYNPVDTAKDDLSDSAAYGILVWPKYGAVIESCGIQHVAGTLFGDNSGTTYTSSFDQGIP